MEVSQHSSAATPLGRKSRLANFKDLLSSAVVNMEWLRELCFQGCPDEEGIRATCWKLLLGYLPEKVSNWDAILREQRESYLCLCNEILRSPHQEENENGEIMDHPLNPDPKSTWHRYFEDNDILLQIDHDSRRLYPDISFFQLPTPYPQAKFNPGTVMNIDALKRRVDKSSLPSQQVHTSRGGIRNVSSKKHCNEDAFPPLKEGQEAHWEVVERLLFLYAKTNSGIGYVQGMNEIIGPLYYIFAQHPDHYWKAHAEADTFFCFTSLMTEIGDKFTRKLDSSKAGIGGSLQSLMRLLEQRDPELHVHLVKTGMDPTFFAFRWITLLLSQEFLLPDLIRIWDSLFADKNRFSFLINFCVAMLISIRHELLEGDFSTCMKLLQHYPITDTQKLFLKAQEISSIHITYGPIFPLNLPTPESNEIKLLGVAHQLLKAIEKDGDPITEQNLLALHSIFQQNLLHALDLAERGSVTHYVWESAMKRELYQVEGTQGNRYICFASSTYCSCPSFVYQVLVRGDSLMCKHQLAARLASAMNKCKEVLVSGKEWATLAASDNPSLNSK